jgi:predicted dehydrogenase
VKSLVERGEIGRVSFARGSHLQDTEGYAEYWKGFPPHLYMTHAVSPILALLRTTAERVHCLGSGRVAPEWQARWGNPYPVETAIFRLVDRDVAVEVTRSLFHVARSFIESFAIYGDRRAFEWQQLPDEDPALFTMRPLKPGERATPVDVERVGVPETGSSLPAEIAAMTMRGGHGGSHPHLVHEFVRSIVEGRPAAVDEIVSANWTAPGICAHASAMREGEGVDVPTFSRGEPLDTA